MRIALIRRDTALDRPDGINVAALSLASGLIGLGHDVHYVSSHSVGLATDVHDHYEIEHWPEIHTLTSGVALRRREATLLWRFVGVRLLQAIQPDVVVSNGILPFNLGFPECNITHDLETTGRGPTIVRSTLRRWKLRRVQTVAATCSEIAEELTAYTNQRVSVIENPIVIGNRPGASQEGRRDVVHVGTTTYKNPRTTVLSFAQSAPPDAHLHLVGPPTPETDGLLAQLDAGVRDRVTVHGFVDRDVLLDLLGSARIVCVPSKYDVRVASPTVLEAAAAGATVIASSVSRDLLLDGASGLELNDAESISECSTLMSRVYGDESLAQRLGADAREQVRRYDADAVARRAVDVLQSARP